MTAMDNLLFITWNPGFAFHLGSFWRALVFAGVGASPCWQPTYWCNACTATAHRRQTVRPVIFLLFRRHPRRCPSGALPVLRTGLLPRPSLGNDPAHAADGQRLGVHRLRRTGQPRRYDRLDARPLALRQENETEHHACTGQHCHRHSGQCHVHPSGQPDELRNHRQAGPMCLGFRFERVDMPPRHPGQPMKPSAISCSSLPDTCFTINIRRSRHGGFWPLPLALTTIFTVLFLFIE